MSVYSVCYKKEQIRQNYVVLSCHKRLSLVTGHDFDPWGREFIVSSESRKNQRKYSDQEQRSDRDDGWERDSWERLGEEYDTVFV